MKLNEPQISVSVFLGPAAAPLVSQFHYVSRFQHIPWPEKFSEGIWFDQSKSFCERTNTDHRAVA